MTVLLRRRRIARGSLPGLLPLTALFAVVALVVACGSGTPIRFYTLERGPVPGADRASIATDAAAAAADGLRVAVTRVVVEPPYRDDRIAYRPPGARHEIAYYHYHRWAAPPDESVARGLVAALNGIEGVIAREGRDGWGADVELAVRVTRLEEIDDSEESIRVALSMEVSERAREGAETGSVSSEPLVLSVGAPVGSRSVEAVVEAFATALDEAARSLASELLARAARPR